MFRFHCFQVCPPVLEADSPPPTSFHDVGPSPVSPAAAASRTSNHDKISDDSSSTTCSSHLPHNASKTSKCPSRTPVLQLSITGCITASHVITACRRSRLRGGQSTCLSTPHCAPSRRSHSQDFCSSHHLVSPEDHQQHLIPEMR